MKKLTPITTLALLITLVGCSSEEEQPVTTEPLAQDEVTVAVVETTAARSGEQIYQRHCQSCHAPGPGHPATLLLAEKLGPDKAVIKGRADLTAGYIKTIVRGGLLEMPPFRPTEITDGELDVIADYILAPG